ncbi:fasciclin-like arabinogalactan protein 21, partial [Phtheirospermum japonicum]
MANSSCSHCWHGPFYIAMAITLGYMAFTTANHARPETQLPPGHGLALNAS